MKFYCLKMTLLTLAISSTFSCQTVHKPTQASSPETGSSSLIFSNLANDFKNAFALYLTDSASNANNQNSGLSAVAQKVVATNSNTIAQAMQDPNLDSTAANLSTTNSSSTSTSTSTSSTTKTSTKVLIVGEGVSSGLTLIAAIIAYSAYKASDSAMNEKKTFSALSPADMKKAQSGADQRVEIIAEKFGVTEAMMGLYSTLSKAEGKEAADLKYPQVKNLTDYMNIRYDVMQSVADERSKTDPNERFEKAMDEALQGRPDLLKIHKQLYPVIYTEQLNAKIDNAEVLEHGALVFGTLEAVGIASYEISQLNLTDTSSSTPAEKLIKNLQDLQQKIIQARKALHEN